MTLNRRLRIAVLQRDGYRCVYCGRTSRETVLEVDHVVPRASGGVDVSTNLVTACRDCNGGKSDSPISLPAGYVPLAVGLQQRAPRNIPTAGDPPPFLHYCADGCFACPATHYALGCGNVLPVSMIDGDAQSIQLAYRCPCGHQWHCWWDPGTARIHADAVRWEARQGNLTHYPQDPRWLS